VGTQTIRRNTYNMLLRVARTDVRNHTDLRSCHTRTTTVKSCALVTQHQHRPEVSNDILTAGKTPKTSNNRHFQRPFFKLRSDTYLKWGICSVKLYKVRKPNMATRKNILVYIYLVNHWNLPCGMYRHTPLFVTHRHLYYGLRGLNHRNIKEHQYSVF
jgi:hypothetical protein